MTTPDPNPTNNIACARARAELVSDKIQQEQMTPAQIGYVAVWLALMEAANQLRCAARHRLTPEQLVEVADRLDALKEDVVLLGDAQTGGHP